MQIFEREKTERGAIFRLVLWMDTKNNWLRRLWVLLTFPLMLAFNTALVVLMLIPALIFWWTDNNRELFRMVGRRWNEPRPPRAI